ncbi:MULTISPECIES: MBL fold metallo-hydrolase [unclassified Pseudoclavibacter]|uniref:MBL fold metallo-hydrolase n=1 Tax=unclassified Pseudoclavibacter TaxID=2615177 RepID=UPI001BA54825|nr:MBL fold metallo-hydrolase [Pseudoclavibacter sp. Marseille-Q4354]MBS3178377.1 MBL fold metallo-hydrolase [Pseudoclavibacter sp. Marseille-Q4354]
MSSSGVVASSAPQEAAWNAGAVAPLELVRDGIWTVGIPMPPGPTPGGRIPCTLASVVADDADGVHVVDPGSGSDENLGVLTAAIAATGHRLDQVRSIIVTHLHHDHLGLAERLRSATGAPIVLHRAEQAALDRLAADRPDVAAERTRLTAWGVPVERHPEILTLVGRSATPVSLQADVLVDDAQLLDVPGRRMRAVHTPGHTPGHLSLVDDDARLVFTGDHVSPVLHPGLGLGGDDGTNPVLQYQRSLRRLGGLGVDEAVPGHGFRFTGLAQRCVEHARHHQQRTDEVLDALAVSPDASIFEIASRLTWSAGWEKLAGFSLRSALQQTAMHADTVRTGSA